MNLIMAGIDYQSAELSIREKFSLSSGKVAQVLKEIRSTKGVLGCVLLSTCNRTELYLELDDGISLTPEEVLCDALVLSKSSYGSYFTIHQNEDAVTHLLHVTSGLGSQLRGDDQILTQVHTASTLARENKTTNSVLETLFRIAVSSGKKIKTDVPVYSVERSVAGIGIETVEKTFGGLTGKNALVIGNGEMGRLSADLLVAAGCNVTITLRSYKHGETIVPKGCTTIPYDDRYEIIPECDVLVSATASNHCTIDKEKLQALPNLPKYILDLAVPRDIDSRVDNMEGITCWNVDSLVEPDNQISSDKIEAIEEIMEEYQHEFYRWYNYRKKMMKQKEVSNG